MPRVTERGALDEICAGLASVGIWYAYTQRGCGRQLITSYVIPRSLLTRCVPPPGLRGTHAGEDAGVPHRQCQPAAGRWNAPLSCPRGCFCPASCKSRQALDFQDSCTSSDGWQHARADDGAAPAQADR